MTVHKPMRRSALLLLAVLLSACGQKGALYLPEPKPVVQPPAAAPAPASQADDKKSPATGK